jgi:hypothetical protein
MRPQHQTLSRIKQKQKTSRTLFYRHRSPCLPRLPTTPQRRASRSPSPRQLAQSRLWLLTPFDKRPPHPTPRNGCSHNLSNRPGVANSIIAGKAQRGSTSGFVINAPLLRGGHQLHPLLCSVRVREYLVLFPRTTAGEEPVQPEICEQHNHV